MPIDLTSGPDTVTLSQGPNVHYLSKTEKWNGQSINGLAGFDIVKVEDYSGHSSRFTFVLSNNAIVTFTSSSGSNSKTVAFTNFEQIKFSDVFMDLGTTGNDSLTGTSIPENLYGFDGNDSIDGGGGGSSGDKLFGGNGNDTYLLHSAADKVSEKPGQGIDTIKADFTYSLADTDGSGPDGGNVERLTLTGALSINGTGNGLKNVLVGNSGVNMLDGGAANDKLDGKGGVDTLKGGSGNDVYFVDQTAEKVTELAGQGTDSVKSSATFTLPANVENLTLTGTGANNATGNSAKNILVGNGAANIITGGGGKDTMVGRAGGDTFDFNAAADSPAGANHDLIKDFKHGTDHIDVSTIDANSIAGGDQSFTFLSGLGTPFSGTPGELRFVAAGGNTMVEGNTNSDKTADFQIELTGTIALTGADFVP